MGHLATICKNNKLVGNVEVIKGNRVDNLDEFNLFNIKPNAHIPAELISVEINSRKLTMKIDSGPARSVLTESVFKEKWPNIKLDKIDTKLNFFYDTSLLNSNARIKVKNMSVNAQLLVIKSSLNHYPLFGRDLMKLFNISLVQNFEGINSVEGITNTKFHQLVNLKMYLILD